MEFGGVRAQRLAQFDDAAHQGILVGAVHQRLGRRGAHALRPVQVGKTLPQIDGLVLDRQGAHHGEDAGGKLGKDGIGGHGGTIAEPPPG